MRKRNILSFAAIVCAILLIFSWLTAYRIFMCPNVLVGKPDQHLNIAQGISFKELKATLHKEGYISNLASFNLVACLLKYDKRVIPGAYRLQTNMSNWEVIQLLRAGKQQPVKVVLHHIRNKTEVAEKITKDLAMDAASFKQLLNTPAFVSQYGFSIENVMTMFIPNTYEVYWTITPEGLFERMHAEYKRFWNKDRLNKAQQLKLTPREVVILASIVQGETNKVEEAPVIAGIYMNRLRKKIPLQSCPTLLYALGDPSARRVLHKYKTINSPYNTYKYRGLPPGPISLPSIAMVDAVLNFTMHNYLYFSAKEDFSGYHYFTQSFEEHLRNARRYQKALNRALVYR